jgi:hypothetical protein
VFISEPKEIISFVVAGWIWQEHLTAEFSPVIIVFIFIVTVAYAAATVFFIPVHIVFV